MKYQQGFALVTVLLVVLGVVIIGGGAYAVGKHSEQSKLNADVNYQSSIEGGGDKSVGVTVNKSKTTSVSSVAQTGQENDITVDSNIAVKTPIIDTANKGCSQSSNPSITLISPNGGEMYTAGQQIAVKWRSCNISPTTLMRVAIETSITGQSQTTLLTPTGIMNDGQEMLTIPTGFSTGNYYAIIYTSVPTMYSDTSNDTFTIKIH